jgi:flagellar assembly factor FliW
MIGFPEHTEYVLLKQRQDSVFMWLHSTTDPQLAFPVVLPWAFYWEYEVKLGDEDLEAIAVKNASQISIMCVVNVGEDVRKGTINLFSPIVINNDERLAKQVINTADGYSTRDPLFKAAAQPTPVAMHEDDTPNCIVLQAA